MKKHCIGMLYSVVSTNGYVSNEDVVIYYATYFRPLALINFSLLLFGAAKFQC